MTVHWNADPVMERLRQAAVAAVTDAAEAIVGEGDRLIASPPKTGRVYRRRGIEHRASAPGESPATDTGALMGSGAVTFPATQGPDIVTASANWSADYALDLELGTEKMEPRPFARPALDAIAPSFPAGMKARVEAAL